MALANTADGVNESILRTPDTLRAFLDNGGVAALPGGAATAAAQGIDRLESDTLDVIDAFASLLLDNLALLPGGGSVFATIPSLALGVSCHSEHPGAPYSQHPPLSSVPLE